MYLHNKLEITKNGVKKVFYNKLLKNVSTAIQDFQAYFNFLSFGSGGGETTEATTGLLDVVKSLPLELASYNIDINKGNLFLSKSIDVKSSEAFSFSEIGVSAEKDSTLTVNRFVLSEPIFYNPSDSLLITVTIYLELDKSENSLGFMAGENHLLGLFLGHNFNGVANHVFTACVGVNKAESSKPFIYDKMPDTEFAVEVEKTLTEGFGGIKFKSTLTTLYGAPETVIGMDGKPVIRYGNYFYPNATTTTKTYTATVDKGMEIRLPDRYVKSVDEVLDTTASTIVVDTVSTPYGAEVGNVNYSPFGEFNYTKDTERVVSPDGNSIAFLVDGRLDYYILEYGVLKKMDTTNFENEGLVTLRIFRDIAIARYYDENVDRHFTRYYRVVDEVLVEGTISIPWGNVEGELWNSFSLNICNALNSYIIGFITSTDTYMGYLVRDDSNNSMAGTLYYTIGKPLEIFRVTSGSNLEDAYGAGYLASDDSLGVYVLRSSGITHFTKTGAKDLFNNKYGCDVKAYNGYFFDTYNEKILSTNCRLLLFCDSTNYSATLSHYAYTDKLFWSVDGRYLIALDSDGINFRYYAFSRSYVIFENIMPTATLPADTVEEIVGLSNLVLVFRSEGNNAVSFPIVENFVSVSPMTVGDSVQVSYTTVDLVGQSGEINMNAECKILI